MSRFRWSIVALVPVLLCAALVAAALAGCGGEAGASSSPSPGPTDPDAVVATVDGAPVHASDVEAIRAERRLAGGDAGGSKVLDEAISRELVRREAARLGAEAAAGGVGRRVQELEKAYGGRAALDAALSGARMDRAQLRRVIADGLVREALRDRKFAATRATPGEVRAYYRRHLRETFTSPASVHLRMIQLRTEMAAEAALDRLRQGHQFAEVAGQRSMDPGSRDNGGDLGWLLTSSLPPDVRKAVNEAKTGLIPHPVGHGFAWWVVDVVAKDPSHVIPFEKARATLTGQLTAVKRAKRLERWLDAARERASITTP
jgi:foldase protein PrsA